MRHSAPRLFLVGLLSVGTFIAACGGGDTTPSIPNYMLDGSPVGPGGDSSVDDSSTPEDAADAADTAPVDCPVVSPDDSMGIYVAVTGANGAACGTRAAPCKTVAMGITRATAASKTQVDIAAGTYAEQVTLAAGIELIGGWDINNGSTWTRSCITPGQLTVLRAPAAQTSTIVAADIGGEAKLTLLRVESKAAASVLPGESLYGILATGSTTTLTLKDVTIEVASAGAGTSPTKGTDGAPVVGTCVAGTGLAGGPGGVGGGAAAGSFDASGYTPAVAAAGGAGTAGNNGTMGGAGVCQACGTCSAFLDPVTPCAFTATPPPTCGTNGSSGCGGNPGGAGAPGTGGGSSIGVFSWDATISITGGTVKSGDGGNGAAGGAGGAAGAGSAGTAGVAALACLTACTLGAAACNMTNAVPAGGTIGGAGGPGGAGGAGGGGGGGSSYATYQGGAGLVTSTATLTPGKAGTGGGAGASAGAPGTSAAHFP